MTLTTRIILIMMLMLPLADALSAQQTTATASTKTETASETGTTTEAGPNSYETRAEFSSLLRQSPPELATILKLDPTLLSNEPYLASYPQLTKFIADHPEVRRNPRFYLGEFELPTDRNRIVDDVLQGIFVLCIMGLFAFALGWLIRTVVEQKRWSRLSKTQSEVHNKILDRFGTSPELLEYMKTPAGGRFLESAPIPLHSEPAPHNAPLARVLWSIQIGIIVVAAAVGTLIVSFRFGGETGQGLFAMGIIALCVGLGFVGSGAISMFVSRRLGVWQAPPSEAGDTGLVR